MKNLQLIKEHTRGYSEPIINAEMVYKELCDIKDQTKEFFIVFYLDSKNKIISREIISIGTLNGTVIHAREVFRGAILRNCNTIILAHNHPSGDTTPSEEDLKLTKKLVNAGEILGIEVLDHVIVGDGFKSTIHENEGKNV